ncbi:MAG: hypothetical protein JNK60_21680 [Acidobacteria bacterium]|nr:hypothetical protein [Acidobacteriota bacterium]
MKAGETGPKKPRKAARAAAPRRPRRPATSAFEEDFGPGPEAVPPPAPGLLPGYACGGEGCALHPLRTIAERVLGDALKGGNAASVLSGLATHSIDVLRMVRDLVNQEIARKETPAERPRRYTKIPVD